MAFMRSTVAYGLFWINLLVSILILIFSIQINTNGHSSSNGNHSYSHHLRGTKEKILLIKDNNSFEQQKLRNLKEYTYEPYILYIDIVAILFVILLMISFCLTHNECCSSDPATNESFAIGSCYGACICSNDDCNCSGSSGSGCDCNTNDTNGEGAIGLLILIVCIIVFVAIYYAVRACEKHV